VSPGYFRTTGSRFTRELELRMALGAEGSHVFRLVASHALALTGVGVVMGAAAGLALTRLIGNLLYKVNPRDPVAFGSAFMVMAIASLAACLLLGAQREPIPRGCCETDSLHPLDTFRTVTQLDKLCALTQKSTFNSWYLFHGQSYSGQNSFAPMQPLVPGTPLRATASTISSKAERVRSVACSSR